MMRRFLTGLAAACLCTLVGCAEPEGPTQTERLSALIAHRLGRRVELHYVETEPDGVHATCGYAGDPPRKMRPGDPFPPGDVMFIWAGRALALSSERSDFDDLRRRNCPSLPVLYAPAIPRALAQ